MGVSLAVALATASAAALVVMFAAARLSSAAPSWAGEALTSALMAATWMIVGLRIAPRHPVAGGVLFIPGAGICWFLARGIVHSVSAYYGLVSFAAACLTAAIVWGLASRGRAVAVAVSVPLLALLVGSAAALGTPTLGITRRVWDAKGADFRVSVAQVSRPGQQGVYLWTSKTAAAAEALAGGEARVELDPGSGVVPYSVVQLRSAAEIEQACDHLRNVTRGVVQSEVTNGSIPRSITYIPFNLADCERGTVWLARD